MAQEAQDSVPIDGEVPEQGEQIKMETQDGDMTEVVDAGLENIEGEGEVIEEETNLEEGKEEYEDEEENTEEGKEEGEAKDEAEDEEDGEAEGEEVSMKEEEQVVEEEEYVEPPVDPTAPLNLRDSEEAKMKPHVLTPEQLAEVEKVWALYQDYNPAYTDLDNVISVKELVYVLKCLLLMTYTPEQMMELVEFVCQPPHPEGLITYEQFLHIVTLRWRDLELENELRQALQVFDPDGTSQIDAPYFREILITLGAKLPRRMADTLIRDLDVGGEGIINIEDVVSIFVMELQIDTFGPPTGGETSPKMEESIVDVAFGD